MSLQLRQDTTTHIPGYSTPIDRARQTPKYNFSESSVLLTLRAWEKAWYASGLRHCTSTRTRNHDQPINSNPRQTKHRRINRSKWLCQYLEPYHNTQPDYPVPIDSPLTQANHGTVEMQHHSQASVNRRYLGWWSIYITHLKATARQPSNQAKV